MYFNIDGSHHRRKCECVVCQRWRAFDTVCFVQCSSCFGTLTTNDSFILKVVDCTVCSASLNGLMIRTKRRATNRFLNSIVIDHEKLNDAVRQMQYKLGPRECSTEDYTQTADKFPLMSQVKFTRHVFDKGL
jgi:hypothetical protein